MPAATSPDEIFSFKTKADFFRKLSWKIEQFRATPHSPFVALNFFWTADSMVDWENPGVDGASKSAQRKARDSHALLLAAEHLAVLAKHSLDTYDRHRSIAAATLAIRSFFGGQFFGGGFFGGSFPGGRELWVNFNGDTAAALGESMRALELAERVYEHWKSRL